MLLGGPSAIHCHKGVTLLPQDKGLSLPDSVATLVPLLLFTSYPGWVAEWSEWPARATQSQGLNSSLAPLR